MKSISGGVAALALALTGGVITAGAAQAAVGTTPRVLINEVYGGGGNSGATFTNDFIELVNASTAAGRRDGLVGPVRVRGGRDLADARR